MTTPILGGTSITHEEAGEWAASRGAPSWWCNLASLCWSTAKSCAVRPEVQWAQACKETGFGKFGGVIDLSYHNPCGMKVTAGGPNSDPNAHYRAESWLAGFLMHAEHLALYAGAPGFPLYRPKDPRHFGFIRGTAPHVEDLGGRWAPGLSYGLSLRDGYLLPMLEWAR